MKKLLFLVVLLSVPLAFTQAQGSDNDTVWTKNFFYTGNITQVSFTPDSQNVAVASGGSILVFKISNGELVKRFDTNTERIYSFTLTEDGNKLVTSGWNSILTIWDFKTGDTIRTIRPDGTFAHIKIIEANLLLGLWGGLSDINNIRVWDINTGKTISSKSTTGSPNILDICLQKKLFAINVDNKSHDIQIWDLVTMTYKFSLDHPDNFINDIRFSPDGKYLGTAGDDGYVKIWDVDSRQLKYSFLFDTTGSYAGSICFSADSKFFISGGGYWENFYTKIWEVESGKFVCEYKNPYGATNSLDISKDNKYLVGCIGFDLFILKNKWDKTSVPSIDNNKIDFIFPNPATDYIEILVPFDLNQRFKSLVQYVRCYNVFGKEVYLPKSNDIISSSSLQNSLRLDVSGFVPGVYFVKIGDRVQRFVKV